MREEKSVVYTIILGVCMLLCLLMLGRMLLSRAETAPSAPESSTAAEQPFTEEDITNAVRDALPFPVEEIAISLGENNTAAVTVAVKRQALIDSDVVPGSLRTALLFLPETCRLYSEWRVEDVNGTVHLSCEKLTVEGVEIKLGKEK